MFRKLFATSIGLLIFGSVVLSNSTPSLSPPLKSDVSGFLVAGYKTNLKNVGGAVGETRFRIRAFYPDKDRTGHSYVWRHFIDDPIQAEYYWRALSRAYNGLSPWPTLFCGCPDPRGTGLLYDFKSISFLTRSTPVVATTTFLTSGFSYTTPADWNNANNSIETIGGGGSSGTNGAGGGGYSKITNRTLSGAISFTVGFGQSSGVGDGGDSYFGDTALATSYVGAVGGKSSGAGGDTATGVGTTKFAGGAGGASGAGNGGGGGAGGPNGTGGAGGNDAVAGGNGGGGGSGGGSAGSNASVTTGGNGGNNSASSGQGTGGTSGNVGTDATNGGGGGGGGLSANGGAGGVGTEWDATHGSGGAAGGSNGASGTHKNGGKYGGASNASGGGSSGDGIITIIYTPASSGGGNFKLLLGVGR